MPDLRARLARLRVRAEARFGRRGALAAGGAGAAVLVVATVLLIGQGGGPAPSPSAQGSPTAPVAVATINPDWILPTPTTTDVVLLVRSAAAPTDREQGWYDDLLERFGRVDLLDYADISLDALRAYFVVFVIDQDIDLDPSVLADAYAAGLEVHLVGAAAAYGAQVDAGTAP